MPLSAHPPESVRHSEIDSLDLFLGDSTPLHATVYARLPAEAPFHEGRLEGVVTGPRCATSRMLPADYALRDRGAGPTRLAQVVIPDPCYWSADLPALYDVRVEWRVGAEVRQVWSRTIGLRRVGVSGRNLIYEGKRWVLRGVWRESTTDTSWQAWHDESAVCVTAALTDDDGVRASQLGSPVVASLPSDVQQIELELQRLSRIPAVLGVMVSRQQVGGLSVESLRRAAPGLLLIEAFAGGQAAAEWADVLLVPADRLVSPDEHLGAWKGPVIAARRLDSPCPLEFARGGCDLLQGDLAPHGDFAGYVV